MALVLNGAFNTFSSSVAPKIIPPTTAGQQANWRQKQVRLWTEQDNCAWDACFKGHWVEDVDSM